jgi:hypothetical protein
MKFANTTHVQPPNEEYKGDRRANAFLPLVGLAGPVPLLDLRDASKARTANIATTYKTSPVRVPDHRLRLDTLIGQQDLCVIDPGHGLIPVEPITSTNRVIDEKLILNNPRQ